jgi:hypothetical protein
VSDPSKRRFGECSVCGQRTSWACADCGINAGGKTTTYVCNAHCCQKKHEAKVKCAPPPYKPPEGQP